jgi:predicted dinucleotide-binding enzyme
MGFWTDICSIEDDMDIGIIGSGNIGAALARHLTKLGHQVSIANSRGPASLTDIAAETGAKAASVEAAAGSKDMVIISIPEAAITKLPRDVLSQSKAIVIDTGNWFPSRDGTNSDIEAGMPDSEWVSRIIGHDVIKAFNNIVTKSLVNRTAPAGSSARIALSVSGNDPEERRAVMALIDEIGFDAVDNGPLSDSWRHQPGSPAYCNDLTVDGLQKAHRQAIRDDVPLYRKAADDIAGPYFRGEKTL